MGFFSSIFGGDMSPADGVTSDGAFKSARTQAKADKAFARGDAAKGVRLGVKALQQETDVPWWRL